MQTYLKFNCKKTYTEVLKFITLVSKDDENLSMVIEVYDKWSGGQIINALCLSVIEYKFLEPINEKLS